MNRLYPALFGCVLFLLVGCVASGPIGFQELPPKDEFGQIYLYRESRLPAAGVNSDIFVDGMPVGSLPNGSFLVVYAPAGTHKIEARFSLLNKMWYKDCAIEVTTTARRSTFSRLDLEMTSLTVGAYSNSTWQTGWVNESEETARASLQGLRINNTNFDLQPGKK